MKADIKQPWSLNDEYRNGGNIVEDRDYCRDCITSMLLAKSRPDVLRNQLESMGITESGDEPLSWNEEQQNNQ